MSFWMHFDKGLKADVEQLAADKYKVTDVFNSGTDDDRIEVIGTFEQVVKIIEALSQSKYLFKDGTGRYDWDEQSNAWQARLF